MNEMLVRADFGGKIVGAIHHTRMCFIHLLTQLSSSRMPVKVIMKIRRSTSKTPKISCVDEIPRAADCSYFNFPVSSCNVCFWCIFWSLHFLCLNALMSINIKYNAVKNYSMQE